MLGPSPPILIDSGSTGQYFTATDRLHNVQPTSTPIAIKVAIKQYMHSTHVAKVPITGVPKAAQTAQIFPDLHNLLLAVAPLCDHGCKVTFDRNQCTTTTPDRSNITCPRNNDKLLLICASFGTMEKPTWNQCCKN